MRIKAKERKQRLATFIRANGYRASIDPYTNVLTCYARGESFIWGNCPTFRQVREALRLPTEYIEITELPPAVSPMGFDDSDPIERAMRRARA